MAHLYFGSDDSIDLDVLFIVSQMPEQIRDKAALSKRLVLEAFGDETIDGRRINANLATVQGGSLVRVYKGTADELNNAVYYTYPLLRQDFPNPVSVLLPRDINLKLIRCARMILSVLTRTIYRTVVKEALRGGLSFRIETLKSIDLEPINIISKGYDLPGMKKLLAFQLGQSLALVSGREHYTKKGIIEDYPGLAPYLRRDSGTGFGVLQSLLIEFINVLEKRAPDMRCTDEYEYNAHFHFKY